MFKVIIAVICFTIVGLFVMTKIDPNLNSSDTSSSRNTTSYVSDDDVKVNITGEVMHVGDYYINPSSTLGALIDMAGGVTSLADSSPYFTETIIGKRTSFYISPKSEIPSSCVSTEIKKVCINTADTSALKGAGFSEAQASGIVSYREANGRFETLEDIMNVSGIGEKTYLALRDKISLS